MGGEDEEENFSCVKQAKIIFFYCCQHYKCADSATVKKKRCVHACGWVGGCACVCVYMHTTAWCSTQNDSSTANRMTLFHCIDSKV